MQANAKDHRRGALTGRDAITGNTAPLSTPIVQLLADPVTRATALAEMRQFAATAGGHELYKAHAPGIMSLLDSRDRSTRLAALEALSILPLEERSNILDTIAERINNANDKVRHHALWAFSKIPGEERGQQAATLRQLLEHSEPGVRRAALEALGMLPLDDRTRHANAMAKLLDDSAAAVRCGALWAIGKVMPASAPLTFLTPTRLNHSCRRPSSSRQAVWRSASRIAIAPSARSPLPSSPNYQSRSSVN